MGTSIDLSSLADYFVYISAFFGAFLAALWISLIFWTFRDIRSRSRDRFIITLATILVAILTFPGLLIYLIIRPKETLHETYQRMLEEEVLLAEIETSNKCPGCGSIARSDWQVCPYCYTRIHKLCTHCGRIMQLPWQICPYCATPVPGTPVTVIEPDVEIPVEPTDETQENADTIENETQQEQASF